MTVRQDSLETYLSKLGGQESTPGGGAAAAITAAQAAALLAMAGHLSAEKNGTATDWQAFISKMGKARRLFLNLAEEDVRAFQKVMDCYSLPAGSKTRKTEMEQALVGAAEPPLRIIEESWEILQTLSPYLEAANAHVVSDAGIAVSLLRASIEASVFNVVINRKFMKEEATKAAISTRLQTVTSAYSKVCTSLYDLVMSRI